jgi:hypothetical protein
VEEPTIIKNTKGVADPEFNEERDHMLFSAGMPNIT